MRLSQLFGAALVMAVAFSSMAQAQSDEAPAATAKPEAKAKVKSKSKKNKSVKAPKAAPKAVKTTPKKKSYLERVVTTSPKKKGTSSATTKTVSKGADHGARLSRDIVFDGSTVNGQYHSAGEAVAKVEQEKQLNELAGVRRDFRDRLLAEKDRLQRGEPVSAE